MLGMLLGLINPVGKIIGQIAEERRRAQELENAEAKIEADERIAALEVRKEILIAQTASPGWWVAPTMRALFALPFVFYFWVAIFFGRTLEQEWAVITDLSERQWWLAMVIVGFYFATTTAERLWKR